MTRDTAERARELAWEAAGKQVDWMQILLNLMNGQETGRDGQPCFFIGGGHFCGRAKFWDGHIVTTDGSLAHRFVSLLELLIQIQAEARERLAAWMVERSFSTGHGDTFEDLLKELDWQVKELRQKARDATLEYVAMWLEANHRDDDDEQWEACCNLPEKIRALAQALQVEEKEEK